MFCSFHQIHSTVTKRFLSWKNTSTLWLHGYWSYDWADNYVKVDNVLHLMPLSVFQIKLLQYMVNYSNLSVLINVVVN